ncbi:MAG: phosphodiester glycosidase family protein [Muribaculaceae bacterium]|nr:phosphodiester glycosidase family protein [Muribaculaceae bacterium]
MKKLLFSLCLTIVASALASARTLPAITIGNDTLQIDTVFHAKVGPGTTHTALHLSGENPLDVFYLTIDRNTPGVSLRSVVGEKLAGRTKTSAMAEMSSNDSTLFFAGVNADFFVTRGEASNGSTKVGSTVNAAIVGGEVYKATNSGCQFVIDADGIAHIGSLNFYGGVAFCGANSVEFHGINEMSTDNGLTLYTPRFWGSTNQGDYAGLCAEVVCRLVDGDAFVAGRKYRLEVVSQPTFDGDAVIPDDGYVLCGRGEDMANGTIGAKDFVAALVPGDIVEIDNIVATADGKRIYPVECVSGTPENVRGGAKIEPERPSNLTTYRHPRTAIGIGDGGSKIVMLVVDGRGFSVGVTTDMLADLMLYAGATEAVNLDGGGSSALYTQALGVRNRTSDGPERAVGNAIYAVVSGKVNDDQVAEIQFADWRRDVRFGETITPRVFAYNALGVLIDSDYRDFSLSCEREVGLIDSDGKSVRVTGDGIITATSGDFSAKMPVFLSE